MATLVAQTIIGTGITPTLAAAGVTDKFVNNEREFLQVKNANATTARVVTINSTHKCSYNFAHNLVVSVPASTTLDIGFFPIKWFNDENDMVNISYDTNADLTVGVFKLSQ